MERLLSELCTIISAKGFPARLDGADRRVQAVSTLEAAGPHELSFLSNSKYQPEIDKTKAAAVIVKDGVAMPPRVTAIRCDDPYAAVTVAIITLHGYRRHPRWGVSPQAVIHETAVIGQDANIAHHVTIAAAASIGDRCTIYPGCYIGDGTRMGDDCVLFPNVTIYDHTVLGHRVTIHAGSVVGEDGLGYAPVDGAWMKIPQVGRARLEDDVEIGANCAIDRATLGETVIGKGTKFGNEVVIGHGTRVGPHCLFVGQVGVAGSVTVGRHVTLAGQVGVAGHLTIGDDARVAAQSGIASNVDPRSDVLGSPALPINQAKRAYVALADLPQWTRRVRDLEREIKELRELLRHHAKA